MYNQLGYALRWGGVLCFLFLGWFNDILFIVGIILFIVGVNSDCYEIPFSDIAWVSVETIQVRTYECSYEAVPVRFLRILSHDDRVLDCAFMPKDDIDALVSKINKVV